jgi:hypothetical protein
MEVTNTGLVFLAPSTLLVPNTFTATFDVFHIPPSPSPSAVSLINTDTDTVPFLLASFLLPALPPAHSWISFQCRGAPNPRKSRAQRSGSGGAQFIPRAESALVLFAFEILDHDLNADPPTEHMFVLDRAHLLRFLVEAAPGADNGFVVLWRTWGPACTRFLDATTVSTHYITTTCGQRMVAIAHDAQERPAPIRLLDFNAARVRAHRECSTSRVDHPRVWLVEADLPLDSEAEEEEEDTADAPFDERIISYIPYLDTTSEEHFEYGAVLIDDAGVIGVNVSHFLCAPLGLCARSYAHADPHAPVRRRNC